MENASKALIMAAGVLIAMMILALAVYLVITFGSVSAEVHQKNEETQILDFNQQFYQYDGRDDLTIYDVVTVANYARNNNMNYEFPANSRPAKIDDKLYVAVTLIDSSSTKQLELMESTKLDDLINSTLSSIENENKTALPKYQCKPKGNKKNIEISTITKRVYSITFEEKIAKP